MSWCSPTCREHTKASAAISSIKNFSCRHQRHIQEDFIDAAGRLCLPGTSLFPAPEPSSCRLPRRACGLSATENSPFLSDDACQHPGFQRCWLNCSREPLPPISPDWGGENIFPLTLRSDHIHQTSVREHEATVKTMLDMCQCVLGHDSPQIFGLLHRSRPAKQVSMESTHIPTRLPALQDVLTKP